MEEEAEPRTGWNHVISFVLVAGAIVAFAIWSLAQGIPEPAEKRADLEEIIQMRSVVIALRAHAADHEGRFPAALSDLVPTYLEEKSALNGVSEDGKQAPLVYHPGLSDTSPAGTPLIEYPFPVSGNRIVAYVEGRIESGVFKN